MLTAFVFPAYQASEVGLDALLRHALRQRRLVAATEVDTVWYGATKNDSKMRYLW